MTLEPFFAARSGDLGSHTLPSIRNVGLGNDLMFFVYSKKYDMVHGYIYISHDGSMVLLYMVTWIPSIYPVHAACIPYTDPMGIYIYVCMYVLYIWISNIRYQWLIFTCQNPREDIISDISSRSKRSTFLVSIHIRTLLVAGSHASYHCQP